MSDDYKEFLELLNCHKVNYVIVGAHAVTVHSRPRSTGDIDILIEAAEENAQKVIAVLEKFGFGSMGLKIKDFCTPESVIQLGYEPNRIDILTSITGVDWKEIWENKIALGRDIDVKDVKRLEKFKPKGG